jgi:hypothetical protein
MLDMGFLPDIRRILQQLPKKRQTLMFSATLSKEIESLTHEFQRTPKIVQIGSENFVLIGSFSDARVAHRLDRSIQKRLAIPFDLAYDPGHSQLNIAMSSALGLDHPSDGRTALCRPAAAQTGPAMVSRLIGASPSIRLVPEARNRHGSRGHPPLLPPTHSEFWRPVTLDGVAVNSDVATAAALPVGNPAEASATKGLTTPPAGYRRQATPSSNAPMQTAEPASPHPWIRPVAIEKVAMGLPISRLQPAINPSLGSLMVPVCSGEELRPPTQACTVYNPHIV